MNISIAVVIIVTSIFGFFAGQTSADPFWMYGLFSMGSCRSRFSFSCQHAAKNEQIIRQMIKRNEKILDVKFPFCSVDVGDRTSTVLQNVVPLLTQQKVNLTGKCIDDTMKGVVQMEGIVVLSLVTFELTQLLSAILLPSDVPLFALTFQAMYPAALLEHPMFAYSYEASFGKDLHQNGINAFRKELNITVAAVLNVVYGGEKQLQTNQKNALSPVKRSQCNDEDIDNKERRAFCVYYDIAFKKEQGCLREATVDPSNPQDVEHKIQMILRQPRLSFVVLYGSNNDLGLIHFKLENMKGKIPALKNVYFINYEALNFNSNKSLYLKNLTTGNKNRVKALLIEDYQNVFYDIPGALAMNNLMYFTHDFKRNFYQPAFLNRILAVQNITQIVPKDFLQLFGNGFELTGDSIKKLPPMYKTLIYNKLKYNVNIIKAQILAWKKTFYVNLVALKLLYKHKEYSPGNALNAKPYCHLTKPNCSLGTELTHSFFRQDAWDNSYGWYCKKCLPDFYRGRNGTACRKCRRGEISNQARSACFDPYVKVFLRLDNTSSKATLAYVAISGLLFLFILFTLVMFWKNRETPIVRASSRHVSVLQISTHALLTVLSVLVFIGEPTYLKCLARPVVVGVLFTTTTAINLGKTQKVLLIFKAKLRMSRREIQKASASTMITVVLALLADIILLISVMLLFDDGAPEKRTVTYPRRLQQELYCSNNEDVQIQLGFIFLVDILNVIQGVRLRHVPSHYRETTYVTYSSFTSSVILIGGTAVYKTQVSEHAKTVTLWFLVLALNCVHFTLVYHYKVWVMMFRPHQNTRAAFEEKRKQRFKKSLEIQVRDSTKRRRRRSKSRSSSQQSTVQQLKEFETVQASFDTFK